MLSFMLPQSMLMAALPASLPPTPAALAPLPAAEPFAAMFMPSLRLDDDPMNWDDGGLYLRVVGGLVTTEESDGPDEEIDFDEGWLLGVALGHRMTSGADPLNFDLEIEGVYDDQDTDEDGPLMAVSDVTIIGGLLNGVVDYRFADTWSVYGGAGIGMAWLDAGTESDALNDFDEEDGPFLAWQLKAGLMWSFRPSTALVFGYRFLNIDDAEIDDDLGGADFDLETQQHVLEIGLRFGF